MPSKKKKPKNREYYDRVVLFVRKKATMRNFAQKWNSLLLNPLKKHTHTHW
jgi:hypothetical protein